jgi:predicted DsbA family dithiol-disulfide isomerase
VIRLDIFSDPVCPWCYVGKSNLDRALSQHRDHPFQIQWHPFQLNPDMPREGVEKRSYLEAKFGGKARVDAINERLREVARAASIALDPDCPAKMPNTLDAHRLIHWAGIEGRQGPVVDALMRAYWVEGRDIGDHEVLADLAATEGMGRAETLRLLASDADTDDILARDEDARRKGVNSVPTFLIARQYVIAGAQPSDVWERIIDEVARS